MKTGGKGIFMMMIVSVLTLTATASAVAEIADRIVAVVNRTAITEFQVRQAQQELLQQGASEKDLSREAVIDFLIQQELVLQEAAEKGILVTDSELDAALENIKRQNNIASDDQLKNALAQDGKTFTEFLEEVRKQIQMAKTVGQEVQSKVDVSDAEVNAYYEEYGDDFIRPTTNTGVLVRQILLTVPENATSAQIEQIQSEANALIQQLRDGADFAEMAKIHSEHVSAESGGELGIFQPGQLAAPFDIAFTLQSGEISDLIRSDKGFHIMTAQHEASEEQEDVVRAKSQIRNMLFNQKSEQQYAEWVITLKDRAYIEMK